MVEDKLVGILRKHLKYLGADRPLAPSDDLKNLGLDSMAAIDLLLDIEDHYGVTLPDRYLTEGTFSTAEALGQIIERLGSGVVHVV